MHASENGKGPWVGGGGGEFPNILQCSQVKFVVLVVKNSYCIDIDLVAGQNVPVIIIQITVVIFSNKIFGCFSYSSVLFFNMPAALFVSIIGCCILMICCSEVRDKVWWLNEYNMKNRESHRATPKIRYRLNRYKRMMRCASRGLREGGISIRSIVLSQRDVAVFMDKRAYHNDILFHSRRGIVLFHVQKRKQLSSGSSKIR